MKKIAVIFLSVVSFICITFVIFYTVNRNITSSGLDMSGWVLSNENFVVVPEESETISFHIEDKQKRTVFVCDKEWRKWDFKFLGIDKDSNITISTADMGDEHYYYNGETWIYNSDSIGDGNVSLTEK